MKISVIGRGTVGVMAAAYYLKYTDWDVEMIYDPNIPVASVGEGTQPQMSGELFDLFGWYWSDLLDMNGSVKYGALKDNWGHQKEASLTFIPVGMPALHFTAKDLQEKALTFLRKNERFSIKEEHVSDFEILDADYIFVSSGAPKKLEEYTKVDGVSLNAAYVTQCYWDEIKFHHTLTIARPWGWVFGIPLQHRCSIGYMYNSDFVSLDEIKDDVQNIFDEYGLTPSNDTIDLSFKNYVRNEIYGDRICYGGNAAFFLEPLEATSTTLSTITYRTALEVWKGERCKDEANRFFKETISDTEGFLALHYLVKPDNFNTPYWDYANKIAEGKIRKEIEGNTDWSKRLHTVLFDPDNIPPTKLGLQTAASPRLHKQTVDDLVIHDELKSLYD